MTTRSELSKKNWSRRKRLRLFKALCHFCVKPIWAKGVEYEGHPWHKGCLEAYKIGLSPSHIGRNPEFYCHLCKLSFSRKYTTCPQCGNLISMDNPRRALRDSFRFYGAKALNPRTRKSKGICSYCHHPIYAGGSRYKNRTYHETCLLMAKKGVPSAVMENPTWGENGLRKPTVEEAYRLIKHGWTDMALRILTREGYLRWAEGKPIRAEDIREHPRLENPSAAYHLAESERYQRILNDIPESSHLLREKYTGFKQAHEASAFASKVKGIPNPRAKCPRCGKFMSEVTPYSKGFVKYRQYKGFIRYYCSHCKRTFSQFSARIKEFNPETRPPREWFAEILPGLRASYPKASRVQLGQIAAGIWWKFTPGQREHYRASHGTAVANPLLRGEHYLGHTKRGVSVSEAKRKGYL